MLKTAAKCIRKILNQYGYEVYKIQSAINSSQQDNWLKKINIKTIIDVGSNEGQFISSIDKTIPGRKIIAFEPIKACYDKLLVNTKGLNITAFNCGLSDEKGTTEINISENFVSSSILQMENLHKKLYPDSKYVTKQTIELKKLDDVIKNLSIEKNILLKIDVQGYEDKVIKGGIDTIEEVSVVIIEFSYEPIYEGQWLFDETYNYFTSVGFKFAGVLDQSHSIKTNIPIFGDAIFIRRELAKLVY